jgi:hypothetical protein
MSRTLGKTPQIIADEFEAWVADGMPAGSQLLKMGFQQDNSFHSVFKSKFARAGPPCHPALIWV